MTVMNEADALEIVKMFQRVEIRLDLIESALQERGITVADIDEVMAVLESPKRCTAADMTASEAAKLRWERP